MSYKLSFWENIFSIVNDEMDKQVCILGFKFRFQNKKKLEQANIYKDLPIQNNKIVFRHHFGSYACNVKYITEEILRQKLPYDIVWVVNKNILKFLKDFPAGIHLVMAGTSDAVREYSTARIWVDSERRNTFIEKGLHKRNRQSYIQTFHGSLGIKKTAPDRNDLPKRAFINSKIDASEIDYLISNGTYTTEFFKRIFWNNGKILETGHPRNDIFFKDNSTVKDKVYNELHIPANKKIVLYAPTLREDKDLSCYTLDFQRLTNILTQKFGGEYVVLLKLHPLILDLKDKYITNYENVIDATDYSDMQELLASADIVITDYSSCIYDFMLTYRPGFIYATDVKKYESGRGLYYPLSSTPFPVAENNDEMVKNIENFDYEKYKKEVKEFLDGKGCIDDGHASKRVVKLIKSIIETPDKVEETIEEIVKK